MIRCLLFCLAWFLALGPAGAAPATAVRLLVPVEAARPGETVTVGIELTMQPGWHTYWRHGGDSGGPTTVRWELPPGVTAGEIRWPAPEWYLDNGFVTFVYHGRAVLLVPLTIAADAPPGPIELRAEVAWLECEKLCLPGRGRVSGRFEIGPEHRPSAYAATVAEAEGKIPPPLPAGAARAYWDGPPAGDTRALVIVWDAPGEGGTPDFYWAGGTRDFEVKAAGEVLPSGPGRALLRRTVESLEDRWPAAVSGLLVRRDAKGLPLAAREVTLAIGNTPPADLALVTEGAEAAGGRGAPRPLSLPLALFFGVIGGLILNIMPCVLPVISLKILGFVREAGNRPEVVRRLGLIYALGVWFSFLVLAGVVIAVKQATGLASWGMQFSNPVFLVALTTLVTLVALSLFGVFEITLGAGVDDATGKLARQGGPAGAFFNGVLAVILATPCTAPFLGPALGFAFTASAPVIVAVFSAVAFGLALPYLLLSWNPAWLRVVPRPGPWMGRFKTAMGFPMLGTAVWLYTLAAPHFGKAGWLALGLFLVVLAVAAWVYGEFIQRGGRSAAAWVVCGALLATGYFGILERQLDWRTRRAPAPAGALAEPGGIPWQPWSPAAVEAARREGRVVFVDFTADWCLTCKVNEKFAINTPAVREKLRAVNAVALLADNTLSPPEIAAELQLHGRAGVPLVLVYPRDAAQPPLVLPEVLTPGILLDALAQAAR